LLSGNIDASTTTIIVADASMIPPAVGFTIQIGSEQVLVNSKSGNTLTSYTRCEWHNGSISLLQI